MTGVFTLETKLKPRWYQIRWAFSNWIVDLARWIYPPSPEVWAFLTQMAMDQMIYGQAILRIGPEEHTLGAGPLEQPVYGRSPAEYWKGLSSLTELNELSRTEMKPRFERCVECDGEISVEMCQQSQEINGHRYPLHVGCADVWWNRMIPVFRVACEGSSYIEEQPGNIADLIQDSDEGTEYTITAIKMKQGEYLSLPEFTGF